VKSIIVFIFSLLLFSYFFYHFLNTNNGLTGLKSLEHLYANKSNELKKLTAEEENLRYKVQSLKEESLDKDIAEERIRYILHKGKSSEEVIMT